MKDDTMPQVASYWNKVASEFDTIYSGDKGPVARVLDRWLRSDMYGRFDWVMNTLADVKGQSICDVGCGSGRFVAALAAKGAKRVVGVDVAPEMLKLARQLTEKEQVANRTEFFHADVLDWKPTEKFDHTIAIGLWDYIADPAQRLANIRGMTTGTFLSAWPRSGTVRAAIRKARLSALGCPCYFYSRADVERLLTEAKFEVTSMKVVGQLFLAGAKCV